MGPHGPSTDRDRTIDRLRALIGFAPVGLERWIEAALGPLPLNVAPLVALAAAALAVGPLLWAGSEKEIVPVTSIEMVERNVPTTVTYVELSGLAMSVPLPAPGTAEAPPYGLLVRDGIDSDAITVVMADQPPSAGLARYVIGRVIERAADAALSAFASRGESVTGPAPSTWLIEVPPPEDETPMDVMAVAGLSGLAEGTLVRIPVAFDGESVPVCALDPEGCPSRRLADGGGIFVHLAHGIPVTDPILVQTAYPSAVTPGRWVGTQARNGPDLQAFAATVPVRVLAGWGRILVVASVAADPTIYRDRLWLGPVLLMALAGVIWLGGRVGYPVFRPILEPRHGWAGGTRPAAAVRPARAVPATISGHATTIGGRWRRLDEESATIDSGGLAALAAGRASAVVRLAGGDEIALAAHDVGVLGSVERGEVITLAGIRPAVWAHWFGTDLRLTFETEADRDLAAAIASGSGPPLRSAP